MGIKSFGKFRHCEVTHGEDLNMEAIQNRSKKTKGMTIIKRVESLAQRYSGLPLLSKLR